LDRIGKIGGRGGRQRADTGLYRKGLTSSSVTLYQICPVLTSSDSSWARTQRRREEGLLFTIMRKSFGPERRCLFSLKNSFTTLLIRFLMTAVPTRFGTVTHTLLAPSSLLVRRIKCPVSPLVIHLILRISLPFSLPSLEREHFAGERELSDGEPLPSLCTSSLQDSPSSFGSHANEKPVRPLPSFVVGLVSPLHLPELVKHRVRPKSRLRLSGQGPMKSK